MRAAATNAPVGDGGSIDESSEEDEESEESLDSEHCGVWEGKDRLKCGLKRWATVDVQERVGERK